MALDVSPESECQKGSTRPEFSQSDFIVSISSGPLRPKHARSLSENQRPTAE